jgi:hypothetical protein
MYCHADAWLGLPLYAVFGQLEVVANRVATAK